RRWPGRWRWRLRRWRWRLRRRRWRVRRRLWQHLRRRRDRVRQKKTGHHQLTGKDSQTGEAAIQLNDSTRDFADRWSSASAFAGQASATDDQKPAPAGDGSAPPSQPLVSRLPSHESGPPQKIWTTFFAANRATDEAVRRTVLRLTTLGEHE